MGIGYGEGPTGFFAIPANTGVFGGGEDGVMGMGLSGRGGIFASERSAQLRLVPALGHRMTERETFTPTIVTDPNRQGADLPKNGRAGNLMSVMDEQGDCTLWFCVRGDGEGVAARWAQVLLGPVFDGLA
jgi:hypothetical protein